MPWSGSSGSQSFTRNNGTHTGTQVWQEDAAEPVDILSDRHDTHDQDLASGINDCVHKGGGNTASADLPMGGFKHSNVGLATGRTHYARFSQMQDNTGQYVATVGGTADAITLTPAIPITAYAAGQRFSFIAGSTNTTAVTINVSAVGAKDIKRPDASLSALAAGDIISGTMVDVEYDGTRFQLLSWKSQAELLLDTSPQLGGDLDTNGHGILIDDNNGIYDDAGNEQVTFHKTASAVNQIGITNAATGGAPQIAAEGGDANITLTLAGKGTGGVVASFRGAGNPGLFILDSNSSHGLGIFTSSNLTASRSLDIQTGDASRELILSGNLTVSGNATVPSGFNAADQSAQETGTATATFVAPGTQHFHPSAAKAWVRFNASGTVAASYNITSVTDNGAGDWTVNIGTDFSSANYCGVVSGGLLTADPSPLTYNIAGTPAAGTFQIMVATGVDPAAPNAIFAAFFGDRA